MKQLSLLFLVLFISSAMAEKKSSTPSKQTPLIISMAHFPPILDKHKDSGGVMSMFIEPKLKAAGLTNITRKFVPFADVLKSVIDKKADMAFYGFYDSNVEQFKKMPLDYIKFAEHRVHYYYPEGKFPKDYKITQPELKKLTFVMIKKEPIIPVFRSQGIKVVETGSLFSAHKKILYGRGDITYGVKMIFDEFYKNPINKLEKKFFASKNFIKINSGVFFRSDNKNVEKIKQALMGIEDLKQFKSKQSQLIKQYLKK